MEVHGKIEEADVGQLKAGQTAQFTVDAYPDRTFSGQVLQIRKSPEVVQNVVTYTAIVPAPNPDLLLLPRANVPSRPSARPTVTRPRLRRHRRGFRRRESGYRKLPLAIWCSWLRHYSGPCGSGQCH